MQCRVMCINAEEAHIAGFMIGGTVKSAVCRQPCKSGARMDFLMTQLSEKEKTRRIIGAVLLVIGTLCTIWGDKIDNLTVLKFGKTTAVVGIVIYFLGRIGKVLRKR